MCVNMMNLCEGPQTQTTIQGTQCITRTSKKKKKGKCGNFFNAKAGFLFLFMNKL